MRRPLPILVVGMVCLLIGAVINIGVAVTAAVFEHDERIFLTMFGEHDWPTSVPSNWNPPPSLHIWKSGFGFENTMPSDWTAAPSHDTWTSGPCVRGESFCCVERQSKPSQWAGPCAIGWRAAGWPMPSLRHWTRYVYVHPVEYPAWGIGQYNFTYSHALTIHDGADTLYIPLQPMWPGFAVNTALYAAAAFALLYAVSFIGRWGRRMAPAKATIARDVPVSPDMSQEDDAQHAASLA